MNERSKSDLEEIEKCEEIIYQQKVKIKKIKKECLHLDKKPTMIESFAYERTPVMECIVCSGITRNSVSKEDKFNLYLKEVGCLECEWDDLGEKCTHDRSRKVNRLMETHPNGFSFDDILELIKKAP
jgi:hypothetical protein